MRSIGVLIRYTFFGKYGFAEFSLRAFFVLIPVLIVCISTRFQILRAAKVEDPGLTAVILADFPFQALKIICAVGCISQFVIASALIDEEARRGTLAQILTRIPRWEYFIGQWVCAMIFGLVMFTLNLLIVIAFFHFLNAKIPPDFVCSIASGLSFIVIATTIGFSLGPYILHSRLIFYYYLLFFLAGCVLFIVMSVVRWKIEDATKILENIGGALSLVLFPAIHPSNSAVQTERHFSTLWPILLENIGYVVALLLIGVTVFDRREISPKR